MTSGKCSKCNKPVVVLIGGYCPECFQGKAGIVNPVKIVVKQGRRPDGTTQP